MQLQNMLRFRMGWASPSGPSAAVALSSRIRLARNLKRPFPGKASRKELAQIREEAFEACRRSKTLSKAAFLRLEELEPVERVFLAERRLISRELVAEPAERGAVVGEREILSVMVNEEDHLRLQAVDSGVCLKDLWPKARTLDQELSAELDLAIDSEWGHLTACPTNVGTGLRASTMLHLPALALSGQINKILEGLSRLQMTARGMYGEGTQVLGDFYQISNATTFGKSEEDFITEIERGVEGLVARELETRRAAAEGPPRGRLEDLVHRAWGLLSHSRAMSFDETIQHLSYVRLATTLGWKVPIDLETLNEAMIVVQPGHVQMLAGREVEPAERDVLRAAYLRKKFKAI